MSRAILLNFISSKNWLNKISKATWNPLEIHTKIFDYFHMYFFAFKVSILIPKEKLTQSLDRE